MAREPGALPILSAFRELFAKLAEQSRRIGGQDLTQTDEVDHV
jgi:hypothetical protein